MSNIQVHLERDRSVVQFFQRAVMAPEILPGQESRYVVDPILRDTHEAGVRRELVDCVYCALQRSTAYHEVVNEYPSSAQSPLNGLIGVPALIRLAHEQEGFTERDAELSRDDQPGDPGYNEAVENDLFEHAGQLPDDSIRRKDRAAQVIAVDGDRELTDTFRELGFLHTPSEGVEE